MSTTAKITALIHTLPGQTKDDVLAAVLLAQHERALVLSSRADVVADGIVQVTLTYGREGGEAEIRDVAHRVGSLANPVDSVRIS